MEEEDVAFSCANEGGPGTGKGRGIVWDNASTNVLESGADVRMVVLGDAFDVNFNLLPPLGRNGYLLVAPVVHEFEESG